MEEDAELVRRVRAGDALACETLVRRHQRAVYLVACSVVGDSAEAEDMSQEAFVRAFRNLDLLVDAAKFGPWLRRIAFGVSIDRVRAFRPELFRQGEAPPEDLISNAATPFQRLAAIELAGRVERALASLPPKYRVPFTLFHVDGVSHARIARALGVTEATSRSLVRRARHKLAPMLAAYRSDASESAAVVETFEEQHAVPQMLHVLNGDSMRMSFETSGIPGDMTVFADAFYRGPVPAGLSDEDLLETRRAYWGDELGVDWDRRLRAFSRYGEVVFWFEHDLFDQLLLIRHLDWFARRHLGSTRCSLICIGDFPGFEPFKGLGQLNGDQLASLLDTRLPVTEGQTDLGRRAWAAFTAPDPRRIEELLESDTSALEFLAPALRRWLEEFPAVGSGLSRSERDFLEAVAGGPKSLGAIFVATSPDDNVLMTTDTSVTEHADWLSTGPRPLVTKVIANGEWEGWPRGVVAITDAGRDVLAGSLDWLDLVPIDRWYGGVHVTNQSLWRWDPRARRLIPP